MLVGLDVVAPSAKQLEVVDVILQMRVILAWLDVVNDGSLANLTLAHAASFAIPYPLRLGLAAKLPPCAISIERVIWH